MNPSERIKAFLIEFIQPVLQEYEFKFSSSTFTFKKKVGEFEQEIKFSRSKWNSTDTSIEFDTHLVVSSKAYNKWYKQEYQIELANDIIYSRPANYVADWNRALQTGGLYDLAKVDHNEIVAILLSNLIKTGFPFLNALSGWQTAMNFIMQQENYYLTPKLYDFCRIIGDKRQASRVLSWFDDFKNSTRADFPAETIKAVELRKERIKDWA